MKISPVAMAKILGDEYNIKIMSATYVKPMSAQELSILFNIPIAASYRRVKELEKVGLIKCVDRVLTRDNKRIRLYRSVLEFIQLSFSKGRISMKIKANDMETEDIVTNILKK